MKGKFITFEGGEGCGKSTQSKRLVGELTRLGFSVIDTREPGGTPLSEKIRPLLKDEYDDPPTDRAELLLFLAARAQLVEKVIVPALEAGTWVVSDRFSDSTVAYQGYGRGLDIQLIEKANAFACGGLTPDLTLLLDVDPTVAVGRMHSREAATGSKADRIENAGLEFHAKLRSGFLKMAAENPGRIVSIDANGSEDAVWEAIWKSVKPLL